VIKFQCPTSVLYNTETSYVGPGNLEIVRVNTDTRFVVKHVIAYSISTADTLTVFINYFVLVSLFCVMLSSGALKLIQFNLTFLTGLCQLDNMSINSNTFRLVLYHQIHQNIVQESTDYTKCKLCFK